MTSRIAQDIAYRVIKEGQNRPDLVAQIVDEEIEKRARASLCPKSGPALSFVLDLMKEHRALTADFLIREANGRFPSKEIYNATAYLRRRGTIRSIGYGKYALDEETP